LGILAGEYEPVKYISISVRSSTRQSSAKPLSKEEFAAAEPSPPSENRDAARAASSPVFDQQRSSALARPADRGSKTNRESAESGILSGSPLDHRLVFSNFLVGRSNQLAYAAAQRIKTSDPNAPLLYNPLYLHACVGLGKTHLLQAIAHEGLSDGRRVIYLTAERFMYGFVAALKAQTAIVFKEKLRAIDLLIIDDIQFLQGKSIQQEFCHTLNALIDARRQIVIAADRPPADLDSLEERVRSRLAGGLCVEMGALDETLRIQILERRVAAAKMTHPAFDVPDAVLAYVANVIQTNGRDLDGAVNRLLAHTSLSGSRLTVETAEAAIRDLVRTKDPKRVKIEDIQKLVASHFNVSRADILSSRRTANVVRPRQIAMYLSKVLTLRSLPEIGRRFGGRDHTTVLHAVRKIETLATSDGNFSEEIELLKRILLD
jgi:chromosomal replication initiator protein